MLSIGVLFLFQFWAGFEIGCGRSGQTVSSVRKVTIFTLFRFSEKLESLREKERTRKARWRANKRENDPEYIETIRQYDRERKRKECTSRNKSQENTSRNHSSCTSRKNLPSTPLKSSKPPSYYRVLSTSKKVQDLLGPSPNTHTTILKHVINRAVRSPRKKKCLDEFTSPPKKSITPPKQSIGKSLRRIAVLRSQKKFKKVKELAATLKSKYKVSEIAAHTGETMQSVYRLLSYKKRKRKTDYKRKLSEADKQEVINIYNDDEVTYSLPDIKYADLRFMHFTIREAYAVYVRKNPRKRVVAEKTFEALKPKFIRTVQETPLRGARCEYCANFGKVREALIGIGFKGIPRNHADSIELTWCSFRKQRDGRDGLGGCTSRNLVHYLPRKECVERTCLRCGVTDYARKLLQQNRLIMSTVQQVTWKEWGKVVGKDKNGNPTKRTDLLTRSGTVTNLLNLYSEQLEQMSLHQFFKIWQLRNFNMTLENIQRGQIVFVHDYQQNLLLLSQDAPSSSHWDHPQLTIHPTAAFYRCPMCTKVVKEDIIHITMDKVHDKYAVNQFIATTIRHMRNKGIDLSEIIEFTDHASSQYKSKFTFYFMTTLGIPCTRHYFGVKHGKGPSDRAGGNFKRKIRSAVKLGQMLLDSNQIEQYCEQHFDRQTLACDGRDGRDGRDGNPHSLFKVYNHRSIRRHKKDPNLKTLEGSRDFLHVVRNTGVKGQVEYRYFDCACQSCTTHQSNCTQTEYADEWKQFQLLPGKDVSQQPPNWFKPIDITVNQNPDDEFMEIEDNMDNDAVQCDEIEEDVCEEEVENERDGHEEELRENERDGHEEEVEVEHDGHEEEVAVERDGHEEEVAVEHDGHEEEVAVERDDMT